MRLRRQRIYAQRFRNVRPAGPFDDSHSPHVDDLAAGGTDPDVRLADGLTIGIDPPASSAASFGGETDLIGSIWNGRHGTALRTVMA